LIRSSAGCRRVMMEVRRPRRYPSSMQTKEAVSLKLALPLHVAEILTGWAVFELQRTPQEVLEALAEELASNEQLRTFTAGLVTE
jgi:cytochrome bd-type quinol oxidase subunit 1